MAGETAGARYEVAVVANALDLMLELARRPESTLSTAEAGRVLGISRSTAYRLLVTLASRGFVEHDPDSHAWTLGPRVAAIAHGTRTDRLHAAALPSMRRLLEEEGETVNLAAFRSGELVYVETLESRHPFRMTEAPGETAPLHATALGKAVLAALPRAQRDELLTELDLRPITARTVRSARTLRRQLDDAAGRGYAVERGEAEVGVTCVGAAVAGAGGVPVAALSVSIPDVRVDRARVSRIGERVAREAGAVSRRLGADGW